MDINEILTRAPSELEALSQGVARLRGSPATLPDASIAIPVNAQGDLENVLHTLADIVDYTGPYTFEVILVVNNYPPESEPAAVEEFRKLGVTVLAIPNVRRPGEAPGFTARFRGVAMATTENVVLFDADCRIPDATALLNWYVEQFKAGAKVAYTHVDYYDLKKRLSIRVKMITHHYSRWFKRTILGIPTTRGSNYAVNRSLAMHYYQQGMLADEMNVGPTFKKFSQKVAYSGAKELTVYTSGRMFRGGWLRLARYLLYRLRYNLRVLPVGPDVAQRTGREKDPVRKYVDNVPIPDDDNVK